MSYIVHLWQQPLPTTYAEAEGLLRALRQQRRSAPDPAADALLAAIAAALPAGVDAQDCWSELPEPDAHDRVLSLSPSVPELGTVLPAIEAAARQLGWLVFDPQASEVRLPSGRALGRHGDVGEPTAPLPPPDLDRSPAVRKMWLQQVLSPAFQRRGWKATRGEFCFVKDLPCGLARIYANVERGRLKHGMWLRLALPDRLRPALSSDGGPQLMVSLAHFARRAGLDFSFEPPPPLLNKRAGDPTYALPFGDAQQAKRCGDELMALYDGVVLDWLAGIDSLQTLEHHANRVADEDCPFIGLRKRNDGHDLLHDHPDLLLAAAVDALDLPQRARERVALYEANHTGRFALPALRELLAVCGLTP